MYNNNENGEYGVATNAFFFKYVETVWIDGREISNTEKTWTAGGLLDFNRLRDIWQELECFDARYQLTEVGSIAEDGVVCLTLEYTLETDQRETIKFIRGISYKISKDA